MAAVSLGQIFVSSCNDEVAQAILSTLLERQAVDGALSGTWPYFFAVGLGLLYLGQQDAVEATLAALDAITHPIGKYAKLTVESMAFSNSGDVLHVQKMLHTCTEHLEEAEAMHQAMGVLGLGLIACGEEIGSEMSLRSLDHILQYGELPLRRAVPLALAMLHISNPKVTVIDTLQKLSHDSDQDVALGAIFSMGLVGAGTNNARLAGMMRQLAAYYAKDSSALFMVRIAQGLLYMGDGLPYRCYARGASHQEHDSREKPLLTFPPRASHAAPVARHIGRGPQRDQGDGSCWPGRGHHRAGWST